MRPDTDERRPADHGTALKTPAKKSPTSVAETAVRGRASTRAWYELTDDERELYMLGWQAGHEAGWKAADDHANALSRDAARFVQRMAGIPERDAEADRAAAIRRAERFGQLAVLSGGAK